MHGENLKLYVYNIKVLVNSEKNNGYFTWKYVCLW